MKLFKGKFCKLVFCAMLGFAAISGATLRPDEVEELMSAMNVPKVAHNLPVDADNGDDLWRKSLEKGGWLKRKQRSAVLLLYATLPASSRSLYGTTRWPALPAASRTTLRPQMVR